jgi:thermostable 8-oxoguanine DNA glycosylase
MKFEWHIEPSDIQAVKGIVAQQQHRTFVIDRVRRNVNGPLPQISHSEIWKTQVMCLLTSQQRSGPDRPVSNFLGEQAFRLSLQKCKDAKDIRSFVNSTLTDFGGIRFAEKISKRATANLDRLEDGGWKELLTWLEKLKLQRQQPPKPAHYQLERSAALYMDSYKGFGPKQSRNFWQALGLMRYEFVLDSRITDWLKKTGFPIPLSSAALGDEAYYVFLSDILREICIKAEVLPCVLDAAVFASYDGKEWAIEDWRSE